MSAAECRTRDGWACSWGFSFVFVFSGPFTGPIWHCLHVCLHVRISGGIFIWERRSSRCIQCKRCRSASDSLLAERPDTFLGLPAHPCFVQFVHFIKDLFILFSIPLLMNRHGCGQLAEVMLFFIMSFLSSHIQYVETEGELGGGHWDR